jgi:multidrug resistance efflux pump
VPRVLAAPGDGYLTQVMVRPGDAVAAGQVLVEFAGEDLQIERSRLQAELAGAQAAMGDAMSRHDRAQLAIHSAKSDELTAQLALADQRIERAQMKAPFDAVVIAGDLAQSLGAPVKKGEPLLTLAPSRGFRAIVEVEDADIGQVRRGQDGSMVLTAQPDRALPLRVQRITPLATQADGRNVFEIEVAIEGPAGLPLDELRPGMRGIARLHTGELPLALAWTSDVTAWLRLAAWRWIG